LGGDAFEQRRTGAFEGGGAVPRDQQLLARATLKARFDILVSIPGIGEITALTMLTEMPELGAIENKCVCIDGYSSCSWLRFLPVHSAANITNAIMSAIIR
jgi:hypothetical protein